VEQGAQATRKFAPEVQVPTLDGSLDRCRCH
jgi:hypothetical protein